MLFARLQSQAISGVAMHVHTHAHQAAGHGAFEVVAAGQVSCMGATGTHGHAKALGGAHHNVSVQLTGWRDQREGQQIGCNNEGGLRGVGLRNHVFQIVNHAGGGGVLRHYCKVVVLFHQLWDKAHQHGQA